MATIFVNFRNGDGDWAAKLIRERLIVRFGTDSVFLSSDSIRLGARFPDVMLEKAWSCDVLLALVGPSWLTATGADGRARLLAEDDWVRREIATALAAGATVAAVLLNNAPLPAPDDLPENIRELAYRQSHRISRRQFDTDMKGLEDALMSVIPGLTPEIRRPGVDSIVKIGRAEGSGVTVVRSSSKPGDIKSYIEAEEIVDTNFTVFEETEPRGKEGTG